MEADIIAWLVATSGLAWTEITSLFDKEPGDTFLEHIKKWISVTGKSHGWNIRRAGLVGSIVYVVYTGFIGG
jgi:hypothetical protein